LFINEIQAHKKESHYSFGLGKLIITEDVLI